MKIIMMRPTYKPELSGGTHLAVDLVEDFIKEGHDVELVTPISKQYVDLVDVKADECKIHRITSNFVKRDVLSRIFRYIDVSKKMYSTAKRIEGADIIMTHSMPPLLGPLGAKLGRKMNIPVLYWEQDIVSESLLSTGIFGKRGLKQKISYSVAQRIEKISERKSNHIVTISEQFKKMHIDRGIDSSKIDVVYNWIDTEQVFFVEREDNPLFDELGIPRDKFIVTYCGNLGVPQNVEIMVEAAELLKDNLDVLFVIIGSGSRENIIKNLVQEKNLPNLMMFPLQPLERSHLVYSIGDVGLVIGRAGTSKNGFPSKTWSIMAAEQTMISCFDIDSELSSFVREGYCGITVKPDSPEELKNAIIDLYTHREKTNEMGIAARKYVEKNFARKAATKKIIKIAENLVNKRS